MFTLTVYQCTGPYYIEYAAKVNPTGTRDNGTTFQVECVIGYAATQQNGYMICEEGKWLNMPSCTSKQYTLFPCILIDLDSSN